MRTEFNIIWRGKVNVLNLPYKFSNYDHGQTMTGSQDIYIPTERGMRTFVKYLRSIGVKHLNVVRIVRDDNGIYKRTKIV